MVAVTRAHARSSGRIINDEDAAWPKVHAVEEHFTALDSLARILGRMAEVYGAQVILPDACRKTTRSTSTEWTMS